MTLGEFLQQFGQHHELILFYALAVPLTALLAGIFSKGQGHLSPWRYLYSVLIYMACLPGIFSLTLNIYIMGFEGRSVLDADVYTQLLPIIVMVITIWLIARSVSLEHVPGFDRLTGLIVLIGLVFTLLWVLEKTRIFFISVFPFPLAILFILGLIGGGLWAMRRFLRTS